MGSRPVRTGRRRTHKQKSTVLRAATVVAPLATLAAVLLGLTNAELPAEHGDASALHHALGSMVVTPVAAQTTRADRGTRVSRSADRMATVAGEGASNLKKSARFATSDLDLRVAPTAQATVVREVKTGAKLVVTGLIQGEFAQVLVGGEYRWVTASYLSETKPADPESLGLSDAPCPDSSVEHNLTPRAVYVYRSVCHAFPQITRYGGWANRGEHASGRAIDIMTSDVALGTDIATFLRAHAGPLDLFDVIWRQHIWTPVRSGEGWRGMPNRGSATANHYDHVHVSVN